jgi:hypothetical protein
LGKIEKGQREKGENVKTVSKRKKRKFEVERVK